ncbi:SusC/RagA family TonB-linked outer membrane protein [Bacteroidota bacterium]
MKRDLHFIAFAVLVFISANSYGQGSIIRGKVTDAETNEALPGVTVVEYDQNRRVVQGTITNINGEYAIELSAGSDSLNFGFIGYKNISYSIAGRTTLDVGLESAFVALQEVVIIAHATDALSGVNERDRASSAVKVDMSAVSTISATSAADALQGQVTGLDIVSSGTPGSGAAIVIRGLGSLGDSEPLIVVDGIAQDVSNASDFDFGSADVEDLGALVSIAPQDIKSVEVLKDAASTAVWGSKGANGVLMITTHRGTKGKTKFDYNYKFSIYEPSPAVPMLNGDEYSMLMIEELHNAYGVFMTPPQISNDPDYVDYYNYSANTDWIGSITRTGYAHDHFFKLSGGGDKTLYYASLNATNELGTTINEGFKRLTTRINLDYNLSRKILFSVNFDYTNSYRDANWALGTSEFSGYWEQIKVRRMAYLKAPNMSIYERDENGDPTGNFFTPIDGFQGDGSIYYNPVAVTSLSNNDTKTNQFQNSFVLKYTANRWFTLNQTVSYQYESSKRSTFLPYSAIGTDWLEQRQNFASEANYNNRKLFSRSLFIFLPIVNETHELTGRVLFEIAQYSNESAELNTRNGPSVDLVDPAASAPIDWMKSSSSERRSVGSLVSINYKLKDRYILALLLRADANSKFGSANRWGLFPSLSAAWRFSNEPFLQGANWLGDSKLRFSWGQSGIEPGSAYARHGIFNTTRPTQYITENIVIPTQIQLSNLRWQTVETGNIGIDLNFFNGRLFFTAEVYNKITRDLLWNNYKIPSSSGFDKLSYFNGGKVKNQGWEAYGRVYVVRRENLDIGINFNISRNYNSFLEFPENFNNIRGEVVANGVYPRQANIGQPIGSFYGFKYLGVYPTNEDAFAVDQDGNVRVDANGEKIPMAFTDGTRFQGGDAKYQDVNYDGIIDINDAQYLGDSNPEFIGGFGANMSWKALRASFQFVYRTGFDIMNEIAMDTEGMLNRHNQSKAVLNRWRREGQGAGGEYILPRAYYLHPANNLGSDRFVEPGDFLRLNNVTVTYGFRNNNFTRRLNIDALEVSVNLRKVLTWTNYSGQDPEIPQRMEDPFWFGTDNGLTPTPRIYSLIFNLRF